MSTTGVPVVAPCDSPEEVVAATEGELVTVAVECPPGRDGPTGLPVGASFGGGQISWTPGMDQAGAHAVDLGGRALRLHVADAFDRDDNVPVVDPAAHPTEYGLDTLHVFTDEALSDDFVDGALIHQGRRYDTEIRVRGALSLQYPKPNLTVRFADEFDSLDPAFDGLDRVVLVAGFDDNSLVRNRLAQQLWADMDPAHLTVPHRSVVVFLDGRYGGVYTMLEDVDDAYPGRHGLDEAGQLFKANDARADFSLDDDPDPGAGFEKKAGDPEDGPAQLGPIADLVEFVDGADDVSFAAEVGDWVDLDDVRDWFAFVSFISAGDSANKNAYWYQASAGGPFRYIPWDFNHSFGQDFLTLRLAPDEHLIDHFVAENRLFERLWNDDGHRAAIIARYRELLDGPLAIAAVVGLVDDLAGDIGVNLDRDGRRWSDDYVGFRLWPERTDVTDGMGELAYIRDWVAARHNAVRAALDEAE